MFATYAAAQFVQAAHLRMMSNKPCFNVKMCKRYAHGPRIIGQPLSCCHECLLDRGMSHSRLCDLRWQQTIVPAEPTRQLDVSCITPLTNVKNLGSYRQLMMNMQQIEREIQLETEELAKFDCVRG